MTMVDVTITVEREGSPDAAIVSAVERAGFTIDRIFPEIRAIYGHGPIERMETVKSIRGVTAIRFSKNYQLPPMSESIPQ